MNYLFDGNYRKQDKLAFKNAQKDDLDKICEFLEIPTSTVKNISFNIFDTREGKQNADPFHSISRASARYNEMAIYRYWLPENDPHFPHEITHLVAHKWASPYFFTTEIDTWDNKKIKKTIEMVSTSFMQEGLAIAVDELVFKRKLLEEGFERYPDDWCRDYIVEIPTIIDAINLEGFGSFENKVIVPFAASLSKYLLLNYGLDKYKTMYTGIRETNTPEANIRILEDTYVLGETEILDRWKQALLF